MKKWDAMMWTKEEQWTSDFMVFEFSRQLGVPTNFGRIFWIFWILHSNIFTVSHMTWFGLLPLSPFNRFGSFC